MSWLLWATPGNCLGSAKDSGRAHVERSLRAAMAMDGSFGSPKPSFAGRALPFLALISVGSWGLSQFLKLPTQMKDDNKRRKKEGRAKFNLEQEQEVRSQHVSSRRHASDRPRIACAAQRMQNMLAQESAEYENKRVPGPRPKGRQPAP